MLLLIVAFAFAVLPGGIFAALHHFGALHWKVTARGIVPERKLSSSRLMVVSWVGSLAGFVLAFVSLLVAFQWDYLRYPERVRDGQGLLALIFSGPTNWLIGGTLSVLGYRLLFCSSPQRLWTAPWLYSGKARTANGLVVGATFAILLGSLFLGDFFLNWFLIHPWPW